ncbi:hypothetical protein GCM10009550_66410 [Actinocorallia libanotica]|uniref:Uncharacterized protein n=1 Tax=Actinocorallia libanotica TaxID=46162 RepID=A0ABN1RW10_9ACTN
MVTAVREMRDMAPRCSVQGTPKRIRGDGRARLGEAALPAPVGWAGRAWARERVVWESQIEERRAAGQGMKGMREMAGWRQRWTVVGIGAFQGSPWRGGVSQEDAEAGSPEGRGRPLVVRQRLSRSRAMWVIWSSSVPA